MRAILALGILVALTASAQPTPGAQPAPQTASLPGTQPTAVAPLPAPVTIR